MASVCLRTVGAALVGVLLLGACRSAPDTANDGGWATPEGDADVPSGENGDVMRSQLGKGFGNLMEIEAVVVAMPGDGLPEGELVVLHIGDQPAPDGLHLLWTYGGSYIERAETAGKNGFVVDRGGRYRLTGYEAGRWEGYTYLGDWDDFGPRQARGVGFSHCFRVLDGERIDTSKTHYKRQLKGPKQGW